MISSEPRDWPPTAHPPWRPPPYSLFDAALVLVGLAILIPVVMHFLSAAIQSIQ